jgi:hypothetical protein
MPRSRPPAFRSARPRRSPAASDSEAVLGAEEASLLDVVDNVLSKGVVLSGDLTIGLAQVDLVYARLSVLLCAADRVLPSEEDDVLARHSRRHAARLGTARPRR